MRMNPDSFNTRVPEVNAHLHTPYSFSAFDELEMLVACAAKEGVAVVGINDFFTTAGYAAWSEACAKYKVQPLYNIEFIALDLAAQKAGLRVNDPGNPGRTYLSGKALSHPLQLAEPFAGQLKQVFEASNAHVQSMCNRLNDLLRSVDAPFVMDFDRIRTSMTLGSIRERHLAKALRLLVQEHVPQAAQKALYERLFAQPVQSDIKNAAALENEIRGKLLKAGGAAFVPESANIFLSVDAVCRIILAAGGIPTYPFLADDAKGNFTDFEAPVEQTAARLKEMGIYSTEFITTRNSTAVLEAYAQYLWNEGFLVSFGSEHNTPAMEPIRLSTREGVELSPILKTINYQSACVMAAHQALVREHKPGYVNTDGSVNLPQRDALIARGDEIIRACLSAS